MEAPFRAEHRLDPEGNPAGGLTHGRGFFIAWQDGPLGRGPERQEPNGAFVETIIRAATDRLRFYQQASEGRFACSENELAISYLEAALAMLHKRTQRRIRAGTEGTNKGQ